ncbi:hypothetical protein CsSME_00012078 [Camellia sinensis var. sinensis]
MPCIRICKIVKRNTLETLRKIWAICILFTQLYLHIFGQRRRKSTTGLMNTVGVWLLYLLADLLATIALGKDSKLNADASNTNSTNLLRGLWATIIFFFLGGPDTLTILRLEETSMWLKQLVGLLTQGVRTSVIMIKLWDRGIVLVKFSLPLSPIQPSLKELIINQLRNKLKRNVPEVETSEASNRKIGEWTLTNYGHLDAFEWIIELEFDESIVIWHVATDVCYHLELENPNIEDRTMPCIRTYMFGPVNGLEGMRKGWEKWDLRILVLYILFTQLYLHVFGRHRRKGTTQLMINVNVWFFYLSDLLAQIALGKLSKVKGDDNDISPISLLRGLWAPIILFYLGGPDTMTVLRLEENQMWSRHAIGLLTQGLRTSYVLILTWNSTMRFSLLALLMLFPGLIRYGERVWVIKSISEKKYVGFLVLQAYSYFQTLNPLISNSQRDRSELTKKFRELLNKDGAAHKTFKLIEIELELMYDMLFSKIGTIFTVCGSILRLICIACIVTVSVGFFVVKKPDGHLKGDLPITVILLVGALCLEI